MHGYLCWTADHLLVDVDVCSAEINENVHNEHDIYDQVHHVERTARVTALASRTFLRVVEKEGGAVGREYGGVDDEQQDQPIPDGLEGAVV